MRAARSEAGVRVISASQLRLAAAERITVIWCQRPGMQWQKACTPPSGLGRKRSLPANITPDVPSEIIAWPASTTPMPTAAAALSPAPAAITTSCARPHSRFNAAESCAAGALPSKAFGIAPSSSPQAASIAADQRRAPTSSQEVPDASDMSVMNSPESRQAT